MALPMKKAADLAKDMAKKGIPGSISMGEPTKHMGSGDSMDDAPEKEMPDSGLDPALIDIAKDLKAALESDSVEDMAKFLQEFCERIMSKDQEQDEEMMDEGQDEEQDGSP